MFVASWAFDIQYGSRKQLLETMKELPAQLKSSGWKSVRSRILEGSIGVPESRFVVEHEFNSIADLEASWEELHKRGEFFGKLVSQMKGVIVSGTPRWEVYRIVE
jgi:hypothetical protein